MRCPKCQAENLETRKFCKECGAKIIMVCPQCGFENLPADKFCGECGNKLTKPGESPPTAYPKPESYTPKYLAKKILTSRSALEGKRKQVTVLFASLFHAFFGAGVLFLCQGSLQRAILAFERSRWICHITNLTLW